jgi:hypothetical protein
MSGARVVPDARVHGVLRAGVTSVSHELSSAAMDLPALRRLPGTEDRAMRAPQELRRLMAIVRFP